MKELIKKLYTYGILPKDKKAGIWMSIWLIVALLAFKNNYFSDNSNDPEGRKLLKFYECIEKNLAENSAGFFIATIGAKEKIQNNSKNTQPCELNYRNKGFSFYSLPESSPLLSSDFELDLSTLLTEASIEDIIKSRIREVEY